MFEGIEVTLGGCRDEDFHSSVTSLGEWARVYTNVVTELVVGVHCPGKLTLGVVIFAESLVDSLTDSFH